MPEAPIPQRRPRKDVIRNRNLLLETARRHFQQHGVNTSLEAIARDAGVGPATFYRHFPSREALLAEVLQFHSAELQGRQQHLLGLTNPLEALREWLLALEDYLSVFHGLPEPLVAAARLCEQNHPLTHPCEQLMETTSTFLQSAQHAGQVRQEVQGRDLFLATAAIAWIRGNGSTDPLAVMGLRSLIEHGYHPQEATPQN
ncbi:TetR/AcrR family transcriptional regulator [Deinococcus roseus]|uniref:TetR family transcriptional regulator n=1 Tax=Deinococcus roseus TaxID=392414 RepID=A0ABQ2DIP7_9DEIO|nr:TetR/AcrR family transcriptional regulator [Deinococcus roseus]GGJ58657.1 TetR family transcriptional regulator [Deinococcus roseus]